MSGWLVPLDIPIRIGGEQARRRAVEELAKAKYGGLPDWADELLNRLGRVLDRIVEAVLRFVFGSPGGGAGISPGFVIAVVLVLVAIGLVVWRVGLPRWRRRSRDAAVDLDASVPAADYRHLAEQHAKLGDWQAAARDRFRALVRELEVRTILDVLPARTAREAAYAASRLLPGYGDDLRTAAEDFNTVMYGERRADEALYRRMTDIDDRVVAAADTVDLAVVETAGVLP
jgi:hypothetical protein